MKKLIFTAVLAGMALTANAKGTAHSKGEKFVGGTISYTSNHGEGNVSSRVNTLTIAPTVGYFIKNDISLGLSAGYVETKVHDSKNHVWTITPQARKYWNVLNGFNAFAQGDLTMEIGNNSFAWSLNVRPGVEYMITKHFGVETTIGAFGYGIHNPYDGKHSDNSNFGINLDDIKFGVKYHF